MKEFWKEVKKSFWKSLCLLVPLAAAGWTMGMFIFYYFFKESYAQSCVWAVWCVFCFLVFKIKQYEL